MLKQDRLQFLLLLYERPLVEVANEAGISTSTASRLINCRYPATPEQIARLEAAIVRPQRLLSNISSDAELSAA